MITLTPAKLEFLVVPGQSVTKLIMLKNESAENLVGEVLIENFGPEQYALNRFLTPGVRSFALGAGESRTLPITVSLPVDQGPGGLYTSVVTSFRLAGETVARSESRLASLVFVKVPGEIKESGELTDFQKQENSLYLTFKNTGNVYLNPYGGIKIKNPFFGTEQIISIDPWFVLPGDTRIREIEIKNSLGLGRWQATAELNRGYSDLIDTRTATFWVLPPMWMIVFVGLAILTFLFGLGWKFWRRGKI